MKRTTRIAIIVAVLVGTCIPSASRSSAMMSVTTTQKQSMIQRGMDIARQFADVSKAYESFKKEYDAEDYGNAASGITDAVLSAYAPSTGLTNAEFTSGVSAMDTVNNSITTNKTNLYKIATAQ